MNWIQKAGMFADANISILPPHLRTPEVLRAITSAYMLGYIEGENEAREIIKEAEYAGDN